MNQPESAPLPFDQPDYAEALRHLGSPAVVAGRPIVLRRIPESDAVDAFGPFPYGSPPEDPDGFRRGLAESGAVTWTCVMRPGAHPASISAFDPFTVKEHFVHLRDGPPLEASARTRRHVRRAMLRWTIALRPMPECVDMTARLHGQLEARAPLSRVARVDRRHFEILAGIEGFRCLVASAGGRECAFLVFAEAGDEIHFHLTAGDEEALRGDGMYALFDHMIRNFASTHDLYLGGTPAGANGEGVGRFKARFANGRKPVSLARVILDPRQCEQLVARLGRHRWFPPYRDPGSDQGISPSAAAPPARQGAG